MAGRAGASARRLGHAWCDSPHVRRLQPQHRPQRAHRQKTLPQRPQHAAARNPCLKGSGLAVCRHGVCQRVVGECARNAENLRHWQTSSFGNQCAFIPSCGTRRGSYTCLVACFGRNVRAVPIPGEFAGRSALLVIERGGFGNAQTPASYRAHAPGGEPKVNRPRVPKLTSFRTRPSKRSTAVTVTP